MTTLFKRDVNGFYAYQDPDADLDYSVSSWIEGATFVTVNWTITGTGSVHSAQINSQAVTVDEVDYDVGELASVFVSSLTAGETYTVNAHATFSGGQTDDRSFRLICREA